MSKVWSSMRDKVPNRQVVKLENFVCAVILYSLQHLLLKWAAALNDNRLPLQAVAHEIWGVKALAHKKLVIVLTHYNFFSQLQQFFQQFYIWTTIFPTTFLEKSLCKSLYCVRALIVDLMSLSIHHLIDFFYIYYECKLWQVVFSCWVSSQFPRFVAGLFMNYKNHQR